MLEAKKKVEKQGQNAKNTPVTGMIFLFSVFHDRMFNHCPKLSVLSQVYDFGLYQKKIKSSWKKIDDLFGQAFKMMVALKDRFTITKVLQPKANIKKENYDYLLTNQPMGMQQNLTQSLSGMTLASHNKFKLKNCC